MASQSADAVLVSDSSENGYNTDDERCKTAKKRMTLTKKHIGHKFVDGWLKIPEYKSWLEKRGDNPFCASCSLKLICSKTGIERHLGSERHKRNTASVKSTTSLPSMFAACASSFAANMEIKLCAFLVENNLSISLIESLTDLLKDLFPKDATLKQVSLGKQKTTNIIRQVLGFHYARETIQKLQHQKFSIIIDETTDMSTKKQLAVIATYFDIEAFETKVELVDMVEVTDGTAVGIYSALKKVFAKLAIPMENIIGYSSDTCNVMFGENNSVSKLLKDDIPHMILVKCSCHMIHLVSSYAALKLRKNLEDLCRDIFNHFHRSSKRQDSFEEFQKIFEVQPHKMLAPGQTRWLSLQACVDRILEQMEPLKHYFLLLNIEDPTHSNERINSSLQNPFTKAYLEFLSYQLGRLNDFNRLFQSEKPLLHMLKGEIGRLLKCIAGDFMTTSHVRVTNAADLNPHDKLHYSTLDCIYLGAASTDTFRDIWPSGDPAETSKFLTTCTDFMIEAMVQIAKRFDLGQGIFERCLICLLPANAFDHHPARDVSNSN